MVFLVTGGRGFIGRSLVKKIEGDGQKVLSLDCDLNDYGAVQSFLKKEKVDVVLHLAGISSVADCEREPVRAFRVNFEATYQLASFVAKSFPEAHFIYFSTGQVYSGVVGSDEFGVSESSPVAPGNVYSMSKFFGENALQLISDSKGLAVTVLRLFNHTHSSQDQRFFLPSVFSQLAYAKKRNQRTVELKVGNVDLCRDIGALSDLLDLLDKVIRRRVGKGEFEIFNVSSGRAKHLRELIECLARELDIKVHYLIDESRLRSKEQKIILGDSRKAQRIFGWMPENGINEQTLITSFLRTL